MTTTLSTSFRSPERQFRAAACALSIVITGCHDPSPAEPSLANEVTAESSEDYAGSFDGSNDYATLGTARFPLPTLPQSISLWIRVRSVGAPQSLVVLRRDDSGNDFGLSETGTLTMWRIWSQVVVVTAVEPLSLGEWHHVAYVHTESQHFLYIDGAEQGTSTESTDNRSPTLGCVGSYDGVTKLFGGEMDELRLWASARTALDIQAEYQNGGPSSDPDMVGYYSFDESEGARVYDRSGNGNHMTLGDGIADYEPSRVLSGR